MSAPRATRAKKSNDRRSPWPRRTALSIALGLILGITALPDGAPLDLSEGGAREGTGTAYTDWIGTLHRSGIDLLFYLRHLTAEASPRTAPTTRRAPVATVVIDEQTYRTAPFAGTPRVTWTPHLGRVIEALDRAGATVIGLDLIFPTSLDRPDLLAGHDKPFLKALYRTGRSGRLVMGEARVSGEPLRPHPGQILAVGGDGNVAPLNLLIDRDDVVRAYPTTFATEAGGTRPSFGAALLIRAGQVPPAAPFMIDQPSDGGASDTYSFADIHACAEAGRDDYLADAFAGRIVLVGAALDIEDRWLASSRYLPADARTRAPEPCMLAADERYVDVAHRRTTPGVFIHAAAISTAIGRGGADKPPAMPSPAGNLVLVGGTAGGSAMIFFALSPIWGGLAVPGILMALAAAGVAALDAGLVLPLHTLAVALAVTFTAVYSYRFTVEERGKRRVHNAFRYFLAPSLVDELAERADTLRLGGETKRMVIWFSDIAGYTNLSEGLRDDPQRLVALVNRYFTVMSGIVERHGGYIDKFIGDAVMCLWNAPLDDPDADAHAMEAAMEAVDALATFNRDVIVGEFGLPPIGTRIGINSGPAVVGNMGSDTRFNYTVTGDTVNLAARFEAASKLYDARVLVGEETAHGMGRRFLFRRLDRLVVKGASRPVKVYEPLALRDHADDATRERARAFRRAMALYDRRRFAEAETAFAALAGEDEAAALYVGRCQSYREAPPPPDWDGSFTMTTK